MEWIPENVVRKDFGQTSPYVAGPGKEWLGRYLSRKPQVMADFGAFYGRNTPPLAELANSGRVIAIDHPNARPALERAAREYAGIEIVEAILAEGLPFRAGEIDAGLCWRVLHNLKGEGELERGVRELRRVLHSRAPLLVSVRATQQTTSDAPVLLEKPDGAGGTRLDLYFSRSACYRAFSGFRVDGEIELVVEEGTSDGNQYVNDYWVCRLVRW